MKKKILMVILLLGFILAIPECSGSSSGNRQSDEDIINTALNQIESGMLSENKSQIISNLSFPLHFYAEGNYDQPTFEAILDVTFGNRNYSIFEFTGRIITITGTSATIECYGHIVGTGVSENSHTMINAIKSEGSWKINSFEFI